MSNTVRDAILQLEEETWRAQQTSGAALLPYLSPKCTMLFPMGLTISSATSPSISEVLHSDAFIPWKSHTIRNAEVQEIGSPAQGAVITYEISAVRPPLGAGMREEKFRALVSSTWVVDAETGKWAMLTHQQTPFESGIAEAEAVGL